MKKNIRKLSFLLITLMITFILLFGSGCSIIANSTVDNTTSITENTPDTGDKETVIIQKSAQSQALPNIADVVAEVKPSVVVINTEVSTFDYFNRPTVEEASGSGWIITKDGYIVTNNHVVENSNAITVVLDDGHSFSAKIVGTDSLTDLAVIKIEAENLPAAKVGDSSLLRIGDWVVAIGNSLGEGTSATNGIVSALNVSLSMSIDQTLYNLIQTNAQINPGNSGGPLVSMSGEVIGITSAKVATVGVEGMGYAISIESASPIIEQLINQGYAIHPWLGVSLYTVDEYVIDRFNLSVQQGAFLVEVIPDSPASECGLEAYDVIVSFDGKDITNVEDLIIALNDAEVGQEVNIVYWHNDIISTTSTILIERPQDM